MAIKHKATLIKGTRDTSLQPVVFVNTVLSIVVCASLLIAFRLKNVNI